MSVLVPISTGTHLRAEQVHPLDVGRLAANVLGTHVDDALEPEARADGRGGDAVLPRSRLGDDALLPQPHGDERLPDGVVDLVGARVTEVLALQVDAPVAAEPLGAIERGGAPDVGACEVVALGLEGRVGGDATPAGLELVEGGHERFRYEPPAVLAVPACARVR